MTTGFVLYDDAHARAMEPFALTRPIGELRVGAILVRERWARVLGNAPASCIGAPHLARFEEFGSPPSARGSLAAGTILVNTRCAPALDASVTRLEPGDAVLVDGAVAAVALSSATGAAAFADGTADLSTFARRTVATIPGWWLTHAWDIVRHLPAMLAADASVLAGDVADAPPAHLTVLGEHAAAVARGAYVEPHVLFDTTAGAVVVMPGARINAFTRIAGPAVIGADTLVAGGRFSCVAIGEHSRVCGEMSVVVVQGHANKAHDGFVGHSILGRWSNLGAMTTTSNLKNSYGPVRVTTAAGEMDTGMQFLGSLVGDHAKTAIGTRLMTGTIIGAGANVFGDRSPDKRVPPFAWGDRAPFGRYERAKFVDVAAHVMQRRGVALTAALRHSLSAVWDLAHAAKAKAKAKAKNTPRRRGR
jgi:UDP-N-acetylglucosamine diphosphorylase/glucosamine-1-phosphate N-acetyltransferase